MKTDLSTAESTGFVPYMTMAQLRAGLADGADAVEIVEGPKSGIFRYDPGSTLADDSCMVLSDGTKTYVRQYSGPIHAEWFDLKIGGTIDNLASFKKLFETANGEEIIFPYKETYYVSGYISLNNTLDIDFNSSTVIAPKGLIERLNVCSNLHDLTVNKDDMVFLPISGITDTVKVGSIILIRSTKVYTCIGDYYDGQILKVTGINYGTDGKSVLSYKISNPIYKTFDANIVEIYEGSDLSIRNLILDMSGCTLAYKGFHTFCYKNVQVENVIAYGSDPAALAFEIVADNISVKNSEAHGFLNTIGLTGAADGGRGGYGFSLSGNFVYAEAIKGSRCKHIITNSQRNIMTLDFHINGFKGSNPADEYDLVIPGRDNFGTLYQAAVDFHGNCVNAFINDIEYDGCNTAIAVRNGNATINNPKIRSRSVSSHFNNGYLICLYEHVIENVLINNAEVYVDPPLTKQTELATLVGVQSGVMPGDNKNIIVNGLVMDGGKLFSMNIGQTEGTKCNIDKIIFKNIEANVDDGISINGIPTFYSGIIGKIELQGNVTMKPNASKGYCLVDLNYVVRLDKLILKNSYFDCTNTSDTAAIKLNFAGELTPPQVIDFSNTTLICGAAGVSLANSTFRGWGKGNFDNLTLDYNVNALSTITFMPGIYASLQNAIAEEWTFRNCRIRNLNSVPLTSNVQCLRFPQLSKINLEGIVVNTDIAISDTAWFTSQMSLGIVPYSARNTAGYITYLTFHIRDGKVFLPASQVTNPTLATATPTSIPPYYDGQIIYFEAYNGVAPYGWIGYGGAWKKLNSF